MSDAALDRLTTAMMLGRAMREAQAPPPPALELAADGWQVWDGKSFEPIPVHADMAWIVAEKNQAGSGAEIIEKTRQLCGDLRIASKQRHVSAPRRRQYEQTIADLRAGLQRIREARAGASPRTEQPKETP